jgi:aminomethyltransferase
LRNVRRLAHAPGRLRGSGARDFLRIAFANNVDKLSRAGKALYTCMLDPDGGVIDDLIVYYFREDWFRIVVNAGTADKDVAWLRSLQKELGAMAEIEPRRDLAIVAVQGPNARAKVWGVLPIRKRQPRTSSRSAPRSTPIASSVS